MTTLKILFWISLILIIYSYLGYAVLLFFLVSLKRAFGKKNNKSAVSAFEPEVTLIIAAYNEEDFIEEKIKNSLQINYPGSKLKLMVITDGSSDQTPSIVARFEKVQLLHQPERKGKVAAMNRAMNHVQTEIVISSDANTLL